MKRLFLLFAFILLSSNTAFAKTYDISEISQAKSITDYTKNISFNDIDSVTFGSYPQSDTTGATKEPIEWIVLDRDGDKTLLFSKYVLDYKCYEDKVNEPSTWNNSTLRNWLNSEFIDFSFNNSEHSLISEISIDNKIFDVNGEVTDEGKNSVDKVFCLSYSDIKSYFGGFIHNSMSYIPPIYNIETPYARITRGDINYEYQQDKRHKQPCRQGAWLRTIIGYLKSYESFVISTIGDQSSSKTFIYSGVRPAIWVNATGIATNNTNNNKKESIKSNNSNIAKVKKYSDTIEGLPTRQSELRSDNHFYLDNNMQKATWVYYITYYYHVDGQGNIEKSKWIEQRYVGADGRMYRGRQTPDGKWVGDDGLVVNVSQDLSTSLTIEAAEPDSWYRTQSGLWYYFENDRTTTKKGWFHDTRDDQWYYLDPTTGIMAVGWTNIGGGMYYFNESHDNEPNWYEVGGGFYESYNKKVKAYGSMFCNEQTPDGKYVDENGKLVTNQVANNTSTTTTNNNKFVNSSTTNRTPIQIGDEVWLSYVARYNGQIIDEDNHLGSRQFDGHDDGYFSSVIGHCVGDTYVDTTYVYLKGDEFVELDESYYGKPVELEITIWGMQRVDYKTPRLLHEEWLNEELYNKAIKSNWNWKFE